jgi:pSer/pThr/pTyr-binding forkhead associated (FHA) protein
MAKKMLVVAVGDPGHFFLSIDAETLTIGDGPGHAEAVVRGLRVSSIQFEVEAEQDRLVVDSPAAPGAEGPPSGGRELLPGQALDLGHSHLRLEPGAAEPELTLELEDDIPGLAEGPPAGPAGGPAEEGPAPGPGRVVHRLVVIDGADQGRLLYLPEEGSVSVGSNSKHADLVLHDLYVARVHCEVAVQEGEVLVSHIEGQNGTLIGGQRITGPHALRPGEVMRVGNSYLRLESEVVEDNAGEGPAEGESGFELIEEEEPAEVLAEVVDEEEGGEEAPSWPPPRVGELARLENGVLGPHEVGPLLGRGHSGMVFRARAVKTDQVVALKVLAPDFPASEAEVKHFAQVLKATPSLRHDNLVTTYGAGKNSTHCWITREYVEGESLAGVIRRQNEEGTPDWRRACRVAVHLGRVLAFLHGHGIVHGDLTPSNILVRGDGQTKLADLLYRKALTGSRLQQAAEASKRSADLPFRAPEQTGAGAPADPRTDLYGLGAVVYALLTGEGPAREGEVVPPGEHSGGRGSGIPAGFEAVVLRLLARRPEERYPSAGELLAEVEAIAGEHGVEV